nr:hypothetical protein [Rhodocyclaceae bacterium]
GMITLTGGKLTTFRLMAEDALALAAPHLGKAFARIDAPVFRPASAMNPRWNPVARFRLSSRYGADAATLAEGAANADFDTIPGTTIMWLELAVAARDEVIVHLDDLLLRRTRLGILLPRGGLDHLNRISEIVRPVLAWTDERWQSEVERYRSIITMYYGLPK